MATVFGITFNAQNDFDINKNFDCISSMEDGEEETKFITKKVYHHDDDPDIRFDYRYIITAWTSDQNTTYYALYLIPEFTSISEHHQQEIIEFCGCDNPNIDDIMGYGINIMMDSEIYDGEYSHDVVDNIAQVIDTIDSFIGFYLDKCQNGIGTTGWDILKDYINDVNWMTATMERYKKQA